MILTCPNCDTRYQTDATKFAPPGRNVRCAKCGHVWFQGPPEPEVDAEPEQEVMPAAAEVPPAPMSPMAAHDEEQVVHHGFAGDVGAASMSSVERGHVVDVPQRRRRGGRIFVWLLLILIIAAAAFLAVKYRQTVATMWPKTASAYAALGMNVNVLGLDIRDVSPGAGFDGSQPVLEVKGRIVNITDHAIPVPEVRVALIDNEAREIYHWKFDAGMGSLGAGASGDFTTRLNAPPQGAKNIAVRFVRPGES